MEKDKRQRQVQQKEFQLEEIVDWSFQSYKDDISSDKDNTDEPMARWIVKRNISECQWNDKINKLSKT